MILRVLRLWLMVMLFALPLAAQEPDAPDYKSWNKTATTAEETVSEAKISDTKLSELRAEMVTWRTTFTDAQGVNADQIATVKSQIAALGDPPAEGQTEDPAIAKRRAELADTLAKLQAPGITAGEAATRADSIIRNIDKLVRERQAVKLLRLSPSALNPVNWSDGLSLFRWMGAWIYDETVWRFTQPSNYDTLRNSAPLIAVLVILSGILMLRGSRWMLGMTRWLLGKTAMRGRNLISGFVSLGQVLLPFIGAVLLVIALQLSSLFGPILMELFRELPVVLLLIVAAWWLGSRVFPGQPGAESALGLAEEGRAEGRFHVVMMGVAVGLEYLVINWITPRAEDFLGGAGVMASDKAQAVAARADAAISVLQAPLQVFAGLMLFRVGQLVRRQLKIMQAQDDDTAFRLNLMRWIANVLILIGLAGPVLGLIGYVSAANALIWPAITSLGLIGIVAVLQGFVAEFWVVITRSEERRREALVPVLAGFVLTIAALPLFALIWGARREDLMELWTQFRNGFDLGGVKISPTIFLTLVVVFAIGYTVTRLLQGALKSSILPKTSLDRGGQNAIVSGIGYIGIFLSAVLAISAAGIDLSSLAIVAGALSVGVGFGLQTIVQNFVSGIILLIERPISEGDWIQVGSQQGIVKAITVRSTRIETFDRSEVIVPNADLISGQVTNWTRANKNGRLIVPVGVAYGTDTRKVARILQEIAEAHPLVMMNPEPFVLFTEFGADSLNFEIRAILSDVNFTVRVRSEINHQINARFVEEGIEIPFAQRDIWLRNPEALAQAGQGGTAAAPVAGAGAVVPHGVVPSEPAQPVAPPRDPLDAGRDAVTLSDNDGAEEGDSR